MQTANYRVWIGSQGHLSDGELYFVTVTNACSQADAMNRIEPTLSENEFISYAEAVS